MSALLVAVDALNDRLLCADSIVASLDLAGQDNPPVWVWMFRQQLDAIQKAAEAVEILVRQGGEL